MRRLLRFQYAPASVVIFIALRLGRLVSLAGPVVHNNFYASIVDVDRVEALPLLPDTG